MIPVYILVTAVQALFAIACVVGYRMLGGNAQRGHLLIGIGSAGLVVFAPNPIYQVLSLFWVWTAAREYQKHSKKG